MFTAFTLHVGGTNTPLPSYAERSWAMSLNVSSVDRILCVPPCLSLAMLVMSSTGTKSWFFIPILRDGFS